MYSYEFLQMQQNPQTLPRRLLGRKESVQRLPSMGPMLGRLLRYQLLLNNDRSTDDFLSLEANLNFTFCNTKKTFV